MVSTRSASKSPTAASAAASPKSPAAKSPVSKKRATSSDAKEPTPKKSAKMDTIESGKPVTKEVTLQNQDEKDVVFQETFKDQGVVIFMYPRANTPGCTKQACGFRDNIQAIKDAGFAVYGLSGDSPKSLGNWKTKESLPFDLLSDPKHELIKYFGSSVGGTKVQRSHVVILKGGIAGDVQPKVSPAESVDRAVEFVKSHAQTGDVKVAPAAAAAVVVVAEPVEAEAAAPKEVFEVGVTTAFDVELETDAEEKVQFQQLFKDNGAIFFMFPKADTGGCTKQACGFNDNLAAIKEAGYEVFGLSGDTPAELKAWKDKQSYKYTFLSDPKHTLVAHFGSSLNDGKRVERSHVIIQKGGKVGQILHNVTPQDSFTKALAFVAPGVESKL